MLLITPQEVIFHAFSIRETVPAQFIRDTKIDVAQEYFIRPAFGERMFQEMLAGEHQIFVNDFVNPSLAHFVRYGLITELAVTLNEQGAIILSQDELTGTVKQKSLAKQNKTFEESLNTEHEGGESTSLIRENITEIIGVDTSLNEMSETKSRYDEQTLSINSNTDIATSDKTADTTNTNTNLHCRPASYLERQLLLNRAMFDANVLLDKAVRYVLTHIEEFPSYDSSILNRTPHVF